VELILWQLPTDIQVQVVLQWQLQWVSEVRHTFSLKEGTAVKLCYTSWKIILLSYKKWHWCCWHLKQKWSNHVATFPFWFPRHVPHITWTQCSFTFCVDYFLKAIGTHRSSITICVVRRTHKWDLPWSLQDLNCDRILVSYIWKLLWNTWIPVSEHHTESWK
jgi:hypothetical protein